MEGFIWFTKALSIWTIPVMFSVVIYGMFRKVPVYEVFTTEAKEGFITAVRIIPYLVAMLVAIAIFRASGAMNILISAISPALNAVGFPPEIMPMAIMSRKPGKKRKSSEVCMRTIGKSCPEWEFIFCRMSMFI